MASILGIHDRLQYNWFVMVCDNGTYFITFLVHENVTLETEITQISPGSPEISPNQFSEVAIMEIQDGRHNKCFMLSLYI